MITKKDYHRLILRGSIIPVTRPLYSSLIDVDDDFIYFDIPFEKVEDVVCKQDKNAIDICVQPPGGRRPVKSEDHKILFANYRVTRARIIEIYS
jgi:hypothetical protein